MIARMQTIPRALEARLREYLAIFPAVVLTGPRCVGANLIVGSCDASSVGTAVTVRDATARLLLYALACCSCHAATMSALDADHTPVCAARCSSTASNASMRCGCPSSHG